MAVKKKKNIILNNDGQGIFEFIIFMPILIVTYMFIFRVGASINGSINQQKLTRRYFYYKVQNDSMTPRRDGLTSSRFSDFALYFVGWRDKKVGEAPVATCYKMTLPFAGSRNDESCEESYSGTSTSFIRVQTAYGLCGATYLSTGGSAMRVHNSEQSDYSPSLLLSCVNR